MEIQDLPCLQQPEILQALREADTISPDAFALQYGGRRDWPVAAMAEQLQCRRKWQDKLPHFLEAQLLGTSESSEQASSMWTAAYKASLFQAGSMLDICGGLGVDAIAFMQAGFELAYNDADPLKAALFEWNARWMDCCPTAVHARAAADLIDDLIDQDQYFDYIYADPSRRQDGQRILDLSQCQPSLPSLLPQLSRLADWLIVKLAPQQYGPDLIGQLPGLQRQMLISLDRECKECLLLVDLQEREESFSPMAHCLSRDGEPFIITATRDRMDRSILRQASSYIYDPDPAILLAGAGATLARQFDLGVLASSNRRLDKSHALLLSGPELHRDFPGRIFDVHTQLPWSRKTVRKYLQEQGITQAHVWRCQTRASVAELQRMLDLKPGHQASCLVTTLADGSQSFIHAMPV